MSAHLYCGFGFPSRSLPLGIAHQRAECTAHLDAVSRSPSPFEEVSMFSRIGRDAVPAVLAVAVTLLLATEQAQAEGTCRGGGQQQSSVLQTATLPQMATLGTIGPQRSAGLLRQRAMLNALQQQQIALVAAALQQQQIAQQQNALLAVALQQQQNALLAAALQQNAQQPAVLVPGGR